MELVEFDRRGGYRVDGLRHPSSWFQSGSVPGTGTMPAVTLLRYDAYTMKSLFLSRLFGQSDEEMPTQLAFALPALASLEDVGEEMEESTLMKTLGWISAGVGAVALGLFVGRELRQRYKFNRRTPYDFYSHSGDEVQDVDFGLGV